MKIAGILNSDNYMEFSLRVNNWDGSIGGSDMRIRRIMCS